MGVDPAAMRRCHVAVDLGASRTRIHLKNHGLAVDEPSLAAVDTRTGSLVAVGSVAARMVGRTPDHIRVARPIASGTVVDAELAQSMLRHLMSRRLAPIWRLPSTMRAIVGVPHDSGPLTRRAATLSMQGLGIKRVELVDVPVAAAVGCGLTVDVPEAAMVVVVGAATSQIAVLSLGAVVASTIVHVGGDAIEHAITEHLLSRHGVILPNGAVRDIYLRLSGAEAQPMTVTGKDVGSGLARNVAIDAEGVRDLIGTPLAALIDGITGVLRRSPPDLVVDLADRGIILTGGGALIPGLDDLVRSATGMPVHVADDPHLRVVMGLAKLAEGRGAARTPKDPEPSRVDIGEQQVGEPDEFAPVA